MWPKGSTLVCLNLSLQWLQGHWEKFTFKNEAKTRVVWVAYVYFCIHNINENNSQQELKKFNEFCNHTKNEKGTAILPAIPSCFSQHWCFLANVLPVTKKQMLCWGNDSSVLCSLPEGQRSAWHHARLQRRGIIPNPPNFVISAELSAFIMLLSVGLVCLWLLQAQQSR